MDEVYENLNNGMHDFYRIAVNLFSGKVIQNDFNGIFSGDHFFRKSYLQLY